MEVGQWVRDDNYIVQFNGYCNCIWCKDRGFEEPILKGKEYYEYITTQKMWDKYLKRVKVADTPQELIEVGDLVETKGEEVSYDRLYEPKYFGMVENIDIEFDQIICTGGVVLSLEHITKILTPNSNGGYDLQWSVSKDK